MNRIASLIVRVYRRIFVVPNRKILWQIMDKVNALQKTSAVLSDIKKQIKTSDQEQQSYNNSIQEKHAELKKLTVSFMQEQRFHVESMQKEYAEQDLRIQDRFDELKTQLASCADEQRELAISNQADISKRDEHIHQQLDELKDQMHRQLQAVHVNEREIDLLGIKQQVCPHSNTKLSLIIPVCNTQKYLPECLDSVVQQDLEHYEVLCIDDGSTDRSPEILERFSRKYPFVRVFHTTNQGLGAARNFGLRHACGQYVCFVDSDDLIKPNVLRHLYDEISSRDLDVLYFDGESIYETPELEQKYPQYKRGYSLYRSHEYSEITDGQQLFCNMKANGDYREVVWLQMYKRAFLDKYALIFPERMLHEDTVFDFACMMQAERVAHKKLNAYIYRIRKNSIMTSPLTEKNVYSTFRCYLEIARLTSVLELRAEAAEWAQKELDGLRSLTLARYRQSGLDIKHCSSFFNAATRALFESMILGKN